MKPGRFVRGRKKLLQFVRGSDFERLDVLPARLAYRKVDVLLDRLRGSKQMLSKVMDTFREQPPQRRMKERFSGDSF